MVADCGIKVRNAQMRGGVDLTVQQFLALFLRNASLGEWSVRRTSCPPILLLRTRCPSYDSGNGFGTVPESSLNRSCGSTSEWPQAVAIGHDPVRAVDAGLYSGLKAVLWQKSLVNFCRLPKRLTRFATPKLSFDHAQSCDDGNRTVLYFCEARA